MRKILCLLCLSALNLLHAHQHIEVGSLSPNSRQLALDGPDYQLALYVPPMEYFSGFTPNFPGGSHATELTFTTETNAIDPASGADPSIELLEVTGPQGGTFSFWEVGATTPTWSRPTGWNATQGAVPYFQVVVGGDGHLHGRAFSADKPGTYQVTFRAVDMNRVFTPSANKTITFNAQQPPQLSIQVSSDNISLSFVSRPNLSYDLQICTDLSSGVWSGVTGYTGVNGNGSLKVISTTRNALPKAFFRLVEY
jgi:hypothetical protein